MTIQHVCGILTMENKFININLIMIWQLYQPYESIKKQLGRYIIKLYNNQLINFYSSFYSCSWDKTVRCFDVETGKEIVN
jgi:hypothetical protein